MAIDRVVEAVYCKWDIQGRPSQGHLSRCLSDASGQAMWASRERVF